MIKIVSIILLILLLIGLCSADDINLLDHTNKQFININTSAIIANTEHTIEIPIYNGLNLIAISLYPNDPTLDGVFGNIAVAGDTVSKYINSEGNYHGANYYVGYGWWEWAPVQPIKPEIGYEYIRSGGNCMLIVHGTYLPRNTYNKYSIFDYSNYIGKNIIRPLRSVNYD